MFVYVYTIDMELVFKLKRVRHYSTRMTCIIIMIIFIIIVIVRDENRGSNNILIKHKQDTDTGVGALHALNDILFLTGHEGANRCSITIF